MLKVSKKFFTLLLFLVFILTTFFFISPSYAYTAPPPWDINIYPKKVYIEPPNCRASFIIDVTSTYTDRPIQIMVDELSEGDWKGPGTLISSMYFDGKGGELPVSANYKTVVTIGVVSPWEIPEGEYKVRIYAFPKGENPYKYNVYDIITVVIVSTGADECDPDYWPPPPDEGLGEELSDETTAKTDETQDTITQDTTTDLTIIIEETTEKTTETWPPPPDRDKKDRYTDEWWNWWKWWRWWRLDLTKWWRNWWPWLGKKSFDFDLRITPTEYTQAAGQSLSYTIHVGLVSGNAQQVDLGLMGLPSEASYSFSVPSGMPSFTSNLIINLGSSLSSGTYPLTITGNGGGKTHSLTVNLIVTESREKTSLSLSANPINAKVGENISIGGAISAPISTPIELVYTRPDGFEMVKHIETLSSGAFSDTFSPDLSGIWSLKARWSGNEQYFGSESQPIRLTIEPAVKESKFNWEKFLGVISIILVFLVIIFIIIFIIYLNKKQKAGKASSTDIKPSREETKNKKVLRSDEIDKTDKIGMTTSIEDIPKEDLKGNKYYKKDLEKKDLSTEKTSFKYCIYCGTKVPRESLYCSNCGKELPN